MTVIQPHPLRVNVGLPGTTGKSWDSSFYIKAHVERVIGSTPNKAKVEIYNLSPVSLKYLEMPGQVLQVLAGSPVAGVIFYGEIPKTGVKTEIKHPNQVTTISATDGKTALHSGYFMASYPSGTTRSQIVTDLLAANALPRGYMCPLSERVYRAPVAFSAPIEHVLDELYSGEPVVWSLQSNTFVLIHDDLPMPGSAVVVSSKTGMIGSPQISDKGCSVKFLQVGAISPGGLFQIQSRLKTGSYKATKVVTDVDSELLWEDTITGLELK